MNRISFLTIVLLFCNQLWAQPTKVAEANNRFSIDLFQMLSAKESGNVFFSPISITTAMGMTSVGAAEETQRQIETVFYFPHNDSNLHASLGKIQNNLSNLSANGIEVRMVNKLWAEKTYKINKSFLKRLSKDYSSKVDLVDFVNQPDNTRETINREISKQTNNKITDLLPSGSINPLVRLVLTNAIYFKGDWKVQFEQKKTKDANFFTAAEKKVSCKMMSLNGNFMFAEGSDYQALELPYKGENLTMLIILPNEGVSIDAFQKKVSYAFFDDVVKNLSKDELLVMLPRFKSTTSYQLKPVLSEMGMPVAFTNNANFSNISPKNDLKIYDVYHNAFVEVNERGTEAAAATAVVIGVKSVMRSYKFEANRPFIYFIRDSKTGLILFMGRLSNPTL